MTSAGNATKFPATGILRIDFITSGTREYIGIVSLTMSDANTFKKPCLPVSSEVRGARPDCTRLEEISPRLSGSKPALRNAAPYFAFSPINPTVFQKVSVSEYIFCKPLTPGVFSIRLFRLVADFAEVFPYCSRSNSCISLTARFSSTRPRSPIIEKNLSDSSSDNAEAFLNTASKASPSSVVRGRLPFAPTIKVPDKKLRTCPMGLRTVLPI